MRQGYAVPGARVGSGPTKVRPPATDWPAPPAAAPNHTLAFAAPRCGPRSQNSLSAKVAANAWCARMSCPGRTGCAGWPAAIHAATARQFTAVTTRWRGSSQRHLTAREKRATQRLQLSGAELPQVPPVPGVACPDNDALVATHRPAPPAAWSCPARKGRSPPVAPPAWTCRCSHTQHRGGA